VRLFSFLLILSTIATGCKTPRCLIDDKSVNEFIHHLEVIKRAETGDTEVFVDEYRNSLIFLVNITGIMTQARYDNTVGYRNTQEFNEDIRKWERWLKGKKCNLTKRYIDSAMSRHKYVPKN
jgi:hypothetical protein